MVGLSEFESENLKPTLNVHLSAYIFTIALEETKNWKFFSSFFRKWFVVCKAVAVAFRIVEL